MKRTDFLLGYGDGHRARAWSVQGTLQHNSTIARNAVHALDSKISQGLARLLKVIANEEPTKVGMTGTSQHSTVAPPNSSVMDAWK